MIRHNLLLLYRGILRAKSYFLINLTGLTAGLICTLLIYLWVRDEISIDHFHQRGDLIYQAMEHQQYADNIMTTNSTPGILAEALREEIPEVEYAATTSWINPFTLSAGDHNVKADGYYVGEVPQLKACYSQGETIDELLANIKEVIELCLEEEGDENLPEFVGIQKVVI